MGWSDRIKQFIHELNWETDNLALYEQALTHSSFAHERGHRRANNERQEFLGDAVLELIISDYLFAQYPKLPEGKLTKLRADLVCEASLARLAYCLNLGRYLRLGRGEIVGGGASRPSLLSDAVEALIGALYLDRGFDYCREKVSKLYEPILQELEEGVLRRDYKTLLQEFSQARFSITPSYRIVDESGPDHNKTFIAEVLMEKNVVGSGSGHSKKEAEQEAAKQAWSKISPS